MKRKGNIRACLSIVALVFLLAGGQQKLSAQAYMHAVGIRAGYSSGLSYKGFRLHRMAAIEADMLYNRHGFSLSALYEQHLEPFKSKQLFLYAGGGAFGGNWEEEFSLGLAAVAGIEYSIRDVPITFSLDWRPMLNLYALFEPDFLDFGLSVRFRFGR